MRLAQKITVFYAVAIAALTVVLTAIALFAFRAFSLTTASAQALTAAEIVRVALTEAMLNGTIDKRAQLINRLRGEIRHLNSVDLVRSELVDAQFGRNRLGEVEPDPIEKKVLERGEAVTELRETTQSTIFRATIPYIASSRGTVNCLQCHQVPEGTVLGAITVTLDLTALRQHALWTVAGLVLSVSLFAASLVFILFRQLRPVGETAREIAAVVQEGGAGHFGRRVSTRDDTEIGAIAREVNRLVETIDQTISTVSQKIRALIGHRAEGDNRLESMQSAVDDLIFAARFKQAIEEDQQTKHVYARLFLLSKQTFHCTDVSLHEVTPHGLRTLEPDGETELTCCRYCAAEIAEDPSLCRAVRTGHVVDGLTDLSLCFAQRVDARLPGHGYVCFPIYVGSHVGAVVQWIVPRTEKEIVQARSERFQLLLREAAPVLEAKRLTDQLRENALRDPMTGLHNRRFLEESIETVTAGVLRRNSHLSILLIDIDWFKQVNDSYGHDAGDAVILALAQTLRHQVRASDWVIRFGGEEFLILLMDTAADQAVVAAEKIREAVAAQSIVVGDGVQLQKTVSIGIADFPQDASGFWQAVKFADVALYRAKQQGRNRVVRFSKEMWQDSNGSGRY